MVKVIVSGPLPGAGLMARKIVSRLCGVVTAVEGGGRHLGPGRHAAAGERGTGRGGTGGIVAQDRDRDQRVGRGRDGAVVT